MHGRNGRRLLGAALALIGVARAAGAQASVTGATRDAAGRPLAGVLVSLEGSTRTVQSDSAGRYRLSPVAPGPQVLVARRVGFAPSRVPIAAPGTGTLRVDLILARTTLNLDRVIVTADPLGRARGEAGTASVIDRDAIANQTAASLQGVLELVPGVPLSPPGLDATAQFALRSVPASSGGPAEYGPSASDVASFGTLIVLDGVPLSNNANLQSLGPRGELPLTASSAGGGIDLRRLPATTIDRVEVIRGIPSARFGDLSQGAVLVDTRAGVVRPTLSARYDPRSIESSVVAGRSVSRRHTLTLSGDVARTNLAPGLRDDAATRGAAQLAHRYAGDDGADSSRFVVDTRLDAFLLRQESPEQPDVVRGRSSFSRESGLRLSERLRRRLGSGSSLEVTLSASRSRQHSMQQSLRVRGATPITERLDEGRSVGRYLGGEYLSRLDVEGAPSLVYGRVEWDGRPASFGVEQRIRAGAELRREWNAGAGYRFDLAYPPQAAFDGVRGFDRPRRFSDVPPLPVSAFYVDDRMFRALGARGSVDLQAGLRADVFHRGRWWLSKSRDIAVQPRVNAQLSPVPWLRFRGGAGVTAKLPSLASLYPAPQYFDVVNVNWFPPDSAERLAVLTTFVRDPIDRDLGFSRTRKTELGVEVGSPRVATLGLVAFRDRTAGAAGLVRSPSFLLRDRYALTDSSTGTGRPPSIIEPPVGADTVPILVDAAGAVLDLDNRGVEMTATLPEWTRLHTRLEVSGAWTRSRLTTTGPEFPNSFGTFQADARIARVPFWDGTTRTGERALLTYRLIHQQPEAGLVITGVIQHNLRDLARDIAGADTLAFAGYVTRTGALVPVAREERGTSAYDDLRKPRSTTLLTSGAPVRPDWMLGLQVAKSLPLAGRLTFYGFNVLDRKGQLARGNRQSRLYQPMRFGVEVSMPFGPARGWGS